MKRVVFVAVGLVVLAVVAVSAQSESKRLALVIGNADYQYVPHLRNPVNDAERMSAKLKSLGFKVITVINGTYRQMMSAENTFANDLTRYDVGLFYYSGHGVQYDGTNYLIPVNAKIRRAVDIQFEAVNASRVIADMGSSGAGVNIIILDACRSDPFRTEFRSLTRGLSVVQAPTGSLVVYSTAPDQVAADGRGTDSPFTVALLQNIGTPGVDVQTMLTSVFHDVQVATHGDQVPWSSSSLTAPFYFAPEPPAVASAPSPAAVPTPAPAAVPVPTPLPAPSGPAVAVVPGSAGTPIAVPKGSLKIDFKLHSRGLLSGWVQLEVTGPLDTAGEKPATISRLETGESAVHLALTPGTYRIRARYSNDVEYPYQHDMVLEPGGTTTLDIPLTYSQKYQTKHKINGLTIDRDYEAAHLTALQHQRAVKTGWGTAFMILGGAAAVGAGVFAAIANTAYTSYQAATTSTDATTYRDQVTGDRTGFLVSAIAGGVSLLIGIVDLASRPSPTAINNDHASVEALDAQIAALRAREALER